MSSRCYYQLDQRPDAFHPSRIRSQRRKQGNCSQRTVWSQVRIFNSPFLRKTEVLIVSWNQAWEARANLWNEKRTEIIAAKIIEELLRRSRYSESVQLRSTNRIQRIEELLQLNGNRFLIQSGYSNGGKTTDQSSDLDPDWPGTLAELDFHRAGTLRESNRNCSKRRPSVANRRKSGRSRTVGKN